MADETPGSSETRPLFMKVVTDPRRLGASLAAAALTVGIVYVSSMAEREGSSAVQIPAKARFYHWLQGAAARQAEACRRVEKIAKLRYDLETFH